MSDASPDGPAGVVVRAMEPDQFASMRAVSVAAFGDDQTIGRLLDSLRASWAWSDELSFVAVRDGEIVGQVLYTTSILDTPRHLVDVLVLSPVGVRPDLHGQGIGSHLIRTTLASLADRVEPLVFLEGSPQYYPRFGFRPGGNQGFRKPSERIPDPAFMALALPNYQTWMTGTLVYPDAFWLNDAVGLR